MTEMRDGVILEEVMNQGVQMAPKARKGKAFQGQSLEPSEEPALPSATLI